MPRVFNAIVAIGISLVFFGVVVPPMFGGYTTAYTGLHAGDIGTPISSAHVTIDPGSPAARAGLRDGDTLGCLNLHDFETLFPTFQAAGYGTSPVRGCIVRNGREVPFELVARPGPRAESLYGAIGFILLRVFAYGVFLFVGSALVILRPSLMTWLLFAFCVLTSPAAASSDALLSLSPAKYLAAMLPLQLGQFLSTAALLLFTLVFPDASLPGGWRSIAFGLVCLGSMASVSLEVVHMVSASVSAGVFGGALVRNVNLVTAVVVVLVMLGRLAGMRPADRARFGWVTFGIVVGVVANFMRLLPGNFFLGTFAGTLTVIMPITLMYAILRRHVIDVRFAISRTVVYGAITTLIVGIIATVDWVTSVYLNGLRIALAIDALVTICLGIAMHRLYGAIENAVDFLVYRRKHEAENYLKRLARTLLRADREDTIDRALVNDPYEKLELAMAALFRTDGDRYSAVASLGWNHGTDFDREHDVVRFLTTERARIQLGDFRQAVKAELVESGTSPTIAIPIFEGDDLRGFALYGLHRDGTNLDPDEQEVLETLCQTAAQAYVRVENLELRALMRPSAVELA
ncbi:MAG TPA: hypothetical protein VGG89_08030 [Candidatus Baltobacteraceae bacterium]|jgi:hypothetical protein